MIAQLHQEGKITIKTFKSNEYAEIISLQDKNLSFQDCTVLYYALNGDYKLLTGDRNLRVIAEGHGLRVSGIIYVIDELLHHDILSKEGKYSVSPHITDKHMRFSPPPANASGGYTLI